MERMSMTFDDFLTLALSGEGITQESEVYPLYKEIIREIVSSFIEDLPVEVIKVKLIKALQPLVPKEIIAEFESQDITILATMISEGKIAFRDLMKEVSETSDERELAGMDLIMESKTYKFDFNDNDITTSIVYH